MSVPSRVEHPPSLTSLHDLRTLRAAGRWRTRFAPAPTGALHLGHVVNAMYVWGIARAFGGAVTVRIEDHDRTRSRPEFEQAILHDLEWLGLESDDGSSAALRKLRSDFRQSDNTDRYRKALEQLDAQGLVFPCVCTRRDIASVTGRRDNEELRYPGTCRDARHGVGVTRARRIRMDEGIEIFVDLIHGREEQHPARQCGDLLARDRADNWTYQFAVVVDDIAQGIDVVIRGEDLLESTGRQIRLARLLGRQTPPIFVHHALVRHPDGSKLSKSSGDTAIRELRERGVTPAELFGRAAYAVGLTSQERPLTVPEIADLLASR